jgi:hypothetical protein
MKEGVITLAMGYHTGYRGKRVITLNWGEKVITGVITLAIHERRGYHTGYGLSHWLWVITLARAGEKGYHTGRGYHTDCFMAMGYNTGYCMLQWLELGKKGFTY